MTILDELTKSCNEAAAEATGLLKKSQMSLDFSAPNPHKAPAKSDKSA